MKVSRYSFSLTTPIVWGEAGLFTIEGTPAVPIRVDHLHTNCFEAGLVEIDKFMRGSNPIFIDGPMDLAYFYRAPPTEDEMKALQRLIAAEKAIEDTEPEDPRAMRRWADEMEAAEAAYASFRKPEVRLAFNVGPKCAISISGRYSGKLPTTDPKKLGPEFLGAGKEFLIHILLSGVDHGVVP